MHGLPSATPFTVEQKRPLFRSIGRTTGQLWRRADGQGSAASLAPNHTASSA
jgi:hypothetical protein